MERMRLDKWLWAARFFKTRSLAKAAIEGGKVRIDGQRAKPSREIAVNMTLTIRQGWQEREVIVAELSEQRRGAPEAALLYRETPQSIQRREKEAAERKAAYSGQVSPEHRPTKKQRRQFEHFRQRDLP
jgi:ribosome-associated heat shock protein Hsp15